MTTNLQIFVHHVGNLPKLLRTYKGGVGSKLGHSNRVLSVKFDPEDPNLLITGGNDCSVFLWDLRSDTFVNRYTGPKVSPDSIDCRSGQVLLGHQTSQSPLEILDLRSFKPILSIPWVNPSNGSPSPCLISSAQFLNKQMAVLAGSYRTPDLRLYKQTSPAHHQGIKPHEPYYLAMTVKHLQKSVCCTHATKDDTTITFGTSGKELHVISKKSHF